MGVRKAQRSHTRMKSRLSGGFSLVWAQARSAHGFGGLALEHGEDVGDFFAPFAAVANEIDRAFFLQDFGRQSR